MIHPETHLVTAKNGIAPAGDSDRCFWCPSKLGEEHQPDCVCRVRTVTVRMIVEKVILVPESWTPEQILWHRNEGSWCCSNGWAELERYLGDECNVTRYEFVREASEGDESGWEQPELVRRVEGQGK